MSTIYYAACEKHKVAIDIWYRSMMSACPSRSATEFPYVVQDFLTEHTGCRMEPEGADSYDALHLLDEHALDDYRVLSDHFKAATAQNGL